MLIAILGREPHLSLAELTSLFGQNVSPFSSHTALLLTDAVDINRLGGTIKLARAVKQLETDRWQEIADYLLHHPKLIPTPEGKPRHSTSDKRGKLTLGLSVYGTNVTSRQVQSLALSLKKQLRQQQRSVRIVPNQQAALNAAQVIHNKLTTKGLELMVVCGHGQTALGITTQVQDIEAYTARDHGRPQRDPRTGMLPPKLAQIMLNLAIGQIQQGSAFRVQRVEKKKPNPEQGNGSLETTRRSHLSEPQNTQPTWRDKMPDDDIDESRTSDLDARQGDNDREVTRRSHLSEAPGASEARTDMYKEVHRGSTGASNDAIRQKSQRVASSAGEQAETLRLTVLDAFCGVGTVLQEALLMGHDVIGSDISPRMVKFTDQNLEWLREYYPIEQKIYTTTADATDHQWSGQQIDAVATEIDLGTPLRRQPDSDQLKQLESQASRLLLDVLANLAPQLKLNTPLCLAVPYWHTRNQDHSILTRSVVDRISDLGYNLESILAEAGPLRYRRASQFTGRELLILTRK